VKKTHPTGKKAPLSKIERNLQAFGKALQALQDEYQVDLVAQPRLSQSGQGVWGVSAIIVASPRQPPPPQ
jgi:hypothetical protein